MRLLKERGFQTLTFSAIIECFFYMLGHVHDFLFLQLCSNELCARQLTQGKNMQFALDC